MTFAHPSEIAARTAVTKHHDTATMGETLSSPDASVGHSDSAARSTDHGHAEEDEQALSTNQTHLEPS